jgi:CelD/BcsL family acetyltransferase involved in cellulose biosynthesis
MKILAIERPGANPDLDYGPLLAAEARRAWELRQADVLREAYFSADEREAVLVLECADVQGAAEALASLPLVKAGVIDFRLIPLVPYDGFARLFASGPLEAPPA